MVKMKVHSSVFQIRCFKYYDTSAEPSDLAKYIV